MKAQRGIMSRTRRNRQSRSSTSASGDDPKRLVKARLLPLVGAGGQPASQAESFNAWRRVLETFAEAERRSSSSKTSTGQTRQSCRFSNTSQTGCKACRSRWSVPRARSCTSSTPWGANARTTQLINLAALPTPRPPASSQPPRPGGPSRPGPAGAARARRRKSALCGGVRPYAHGPRRTGGGRGYAGLGSGAHRRAPRHVEPRS